jgi:hypothetical protein
MDELMKPLVQGAQGQCPDVQVLRLLAHLSQTESQSTPALDLDLHVMTDTQVGAQQASKVDLYTTTAFTPYTRQVELQGTPLHQQGSFSKPITREPVARPCPTPTTSAFSEQPSGHSRPSAMIRPTKNMADNRH